MAVVTFKFDLGDRVWTPDGRPGTVTSMTVCELGRRVWVQLDDREATYSEDALQASA